MLKKWLILMAPDGPGADGGGAGGGGGEPPDILEGAEGGGGGGGEPTTEPTPGQEPSPELPPEEPRTSLTKEDMAEILREAGLGAREEPRQQQPQPDRQFTQEDFNRAFRVMQFDPNFLTQLRDENPEVALKALVQLRDGLVTQALTMAEARVQQLLKNLSDQQIAPIQSYVGERQAREFRDDFFSQYPDLEDYEPLVDAVASKLQAAGFHADSRDEVMKKFAEETQAIIKTLQEKGGQVAPGNGGGKAAPQPQQRRMSTLTGGGQPGSGKGAAKKAEGPPGMEVFD